MISNELYYKWIDAIVAIIKNHNLVQASVARNVGLSSQYLNNILTKKQKASQEVIEHISNCLSLSYKDFILSSGEVVQFQNTDKLKMLAPLIETLTFEQINMLIEFIPIIKKYI